jgi:two-component system chemotaxis response regulator CheV
LTNEILLESGTNEVEVLEFYLCGQSFGINVAKVLQLEMYNPEMVTKTPGAADGFVGVYLWRGETLMFMDLADILGLERKTEPPRPIVLVTEFNAVRAAFLVDGVHQVYRVSWEEMKPVSQFMSNYSSRTIATLNVEQSPEEEKEEKLEILMLDFESILGEYCPESNLGYGNVELTPTDEPVKRENAKVVIAEDSAFLRHIITQTLNQAHYRQLTIFENGQDAFEYINERKNETDASGSLKGLVDVVISDIEMPLMDGLTLCRRIKQDLGLDELPVVFFSSLINEQMRLKCQEVGSEAQITKPEIGKLVSLVDDVCLDVKPQPDMDI